jgi:hypothetical protein
VNGESLVKDSMPGRESIGRDRDRHGWYVSAVDRGVTGQGRKGVQSGAVRGKIQGREGE